MIVATSPPYARRTPGLAMRPSRRPAVATLGRAPGGGGRQRVRVSPQRPALRIARGERLVRGLVDLVVGRDTRLLGQLGLCAGSLVGHLLPPSWNPAATWARAPGTERWAAPAFQGGRP